MSLRSPVSLALIAAALLLPALASAHEVVPGDAYLDRLFRLLARPGIQTVDVIQFRFSKVDRPRLVTGKILRRLVELSKSAKVRVFLDNHDGGNDGAIRALKAAGVPVRSTTRSRTSHTKALCVDGRTILLGSSNWTHTSLTKNNEVNLLVEDPKLGAAYTKNFKRLWSGDHSNQAIRSADSNGLRLLTDAAFHTEATRLIGATKKTLDLSTYFLAYREKYATGNDKVVGDLFAALANRVVTEGVKVRLFLDHNGIPEKSSHTRSAMNAVRHLRDKINAGFKAQESRAHADQFVQVVFDPLRKISHGKILLRDAGTSDSELLLGSTNLYWKDLQKNLQLNVLSRDATLNTAVLGYYEELLKQGGLYYRFWRGVRRKVWNPEVLDHYRAVDRPVPCLDPKLQGQAGAVSFDFDDFECLLNRWLIPATPSYAAETTLQAYLPVLPNRRHPTFVHDEIAVIAYGDEAEYNRLRSVGGAEGETYGPLHMDVFGRERDGIKSGSMVPVPYTGEVRFQDVKGEAAACYDLFSGRPDWQTGATQVRLLRRSKDEDGTERLIENLDRVQKTRGLDGYLILIGRDYLVEYAHAKSSRAFRGLPFSGPATNESPVLESLRPQGLTVTAKDPLAYAPLAYGPDGEGAAANVRFWRGKKPGAVRHYRLERAAQD